MKKLKIGIIGAGKIAETAHIPALLKSYLAEFSVIIENNQERANYLKNNLGIDVPHIKNLNQLQHKLDGIIICTPNDTHKELCIECFDRGINVLVEKPLANTYVDSLEIQQKSQETGCILMIGYCTRFWPSSQYLKELIDSKILGEVKKFAFQYGAAGGWAPVSNYISSKKRAGGGAFVINGSHYLDRMLWYFGTPNSYTFHDDAIDGLEANALAEFTYCSGTNPFKGIMRVSKTVNLNAGCFIECEKGVIIQQDWRSPSVSIKYTTQNSSIKFGSENDDFDINKRPDMYLEQLNEFINRIQNKNYTGISDLEQAVENARITEELYKNRFQLDCNWYNK